MTVLSLHGEIPITVVIASLLALLTLWVSHIYSSHAAFAALKDSGSVVTWGDSDHGGNSFSVSSSLTSGVSHIYSSHAAFAALKDDGSVVTWGDSDHGGNSSSVISSLTSGVVGFADPLKNDMTALLLRSVMSRPQLLMDPTQLMIRFPYLLFSQNPSRLIRRMELQLWN